MHFKMCLNEACNKFAYVKKKSVVSYSKRSSKRRWFFTIVFSFGLENSIRKDQWNQMGLKLNETYQLLIYVDDTLGDNIGTIKKTQEL
jgi:hypothetical protein